MISTHTLTWSVTPRYVTHSYSSCNFNSHAHVERDPSDTQPKYVVFISTHTLTWSVTFGFGSLTVIALFQLTRSRGA